MKLSKNDIYFDFQFALSVSGGAGSLAHKSTVSVVTGPRLEVPWSTITVWARVPTLSGDAIFNIIKHIWLCLFWNMQFYYVVLIFFVLKENYTSLKSEFICRPEGTPWWIKRGSFTDNELVFVENFGKEQQLGQRAFPGLGNPKPHTKVFHTTYWKLNFILILQVLKSAICFNIFIISQACVAYIPLLFWRIIEG